MSTGRAERDVRRYVSVARMAELIEQYKATGPGDDTQLAPSYNVAPTNKVYAVLERDLGGGAGAVREVRSVRWGLVPTWWGLVKLSV
jgi:putative SOS response-associated peptidase YedK